MLLLLYRSSIFSICIIYLGLHLGLLADTFIQSHNNTTTIYRCRYSKDVHRTKCQALTIARLTRSLYTTKLTRIRCYTMLRVLWTDIFNLLNSKAVITFVTCLLVLSLLLWQSEHLSFNCLSIHSTPGTARQVASESKSRNP